MGFSSTRDVVFASVSILDIQYHTIPRNQPARFLRMEDLVKGISRCRVRDVAGGASRMVARPAASARARAVTPLVSPPAG